jgi:hypothetical protein
MSNKKKIEGSNGLEDTELTAQEKHNKMMTGAKKAEDEAQLAQAKADSDAKIKADADAKANAMAEAEAQAILDEQAKLATVEEENDIHSFAVTSNLQKIFETPRIDPPRHEHQAKSTMNIDSFTGVIKEGGCLRIDQLIASSVILNIQIWFLSKDVPKFTVGDLSDFSCYIDASEGARKVSLQEDGKFDALYATVKPNYRDIIIKFESSFVGKIKTLITYNV